MDFIERIFGIAPDAGNGSTEAVVLVALAFIAAVLLRRHYSPRRIVKR